MLLDLASLDQLVMPNNGSREFQQAVKNIGPLCPVHVIPPPTKHALKHKGARTAAWTPEEKRLAKREFSIPLGTEVLLVYFEFLYAKECSLEKS